MTIEVALAFAVVAFLTCVVVALWSWRQQRQITEVAKAMEEGFKALQAGTLQAIARAETADERSRALRTHFKPKGKRQRAKGRKS